MDELITSSIAIGDADSFDLEGSLEIRECSDDPLYPISLEGFTKGGHEVNISLSKHDVADLADYFFNH